MRKPDQPKISRRTMIRFIGWIIAIPLVGLASQVVKREKNRRVNNEVRILIADIPAGISIVGEYCINRIPGEILVFSAKCTHLGCRINSTGDNKLLCRCHGSEFDGGTGAVLKGPAGKPLVPVSHKKEDGYLVINDIGI